MCRGIIVDLADAVGGVDGGCRRLVDDGRAHGLPGVHLLLREGGSFHADDGGSLMDGWVDGLVGRRSPSHGLVGRLGRLVQRKVVVDVLEDFSEAELS